MLLVPLVVVVAALGLLAQMAQRQRQAQVVLGIMFGALGTPVVGVLLHIILTVLLVVRAVEDMAELLQAKQALMGRLILEEVGVVDTSTTPPRPCGAAAPAVPA